MTVIDLGERRDVPPPADPRPGRAVRPWAPALVALLCLAVLTAAAPRPAQPPGAVIPARPDADVAVAGDLLLVVDSTGPGAASGPGPERRVAAHHLPSGRPLWHLPLAGPVSPFPARVGDVVALTMPEGETGTQVVGLAAADGAVRWRVDGQLYGATPAGNLLVWGVTGAGPGAPELRSVDAATGTARWALRLPLETLHRSTRDGRVTLLTVLDGGRLELRDPDSGDLRHAAALPATAEPPEVLGVTDDLVLVSEGPGVLSAYDTAALRRRWSVPRGPSARAYAFGCGVVICVEDGGRGLRLLDPATGSARWRADDWPLLTPVGDRLLAAGYPHGGVADHALLDAATGRPVRELGRWQLGDLALWEDRATLHRRQRDGRVLIGRLDERGDGVRVVAALHGVVGTCGSYGSLVICRREGGAYGVWDLPG
ncbi:MULTISPECIES: PQQ-binding-like beta-propeller repeat protein [unclassified Micromonospora]|uniref:outer membrane protein assembly factor BamB family protein n=1 Tax=unclassified Micromonospora TaxID=2617518 RepID=UPI003321703D